MDTLVTFTNIPIIKHMLMLDVVFYGMGIANILAGNFSNERISRLNAFSPQVTSHFVQRFLTEIGAEKRLVTSTFGHFMCLYFLKELNIELDIRFDTRAFDVSVEKPFTNVSNLYISRNGLSALASTEDCSPFSDLLNCCLTRRCKLNVQSPMHPHVYDTIRQMYENGWTIENMAISIVSLETPQPCPICREVMKGEVVQTACRHYFCVRCWANHWKHSVGDIDNNIFRFNLVGHPIKINCPMCRREMNSWECAPLKDDTS